MVDAPDGRGDDHVAIATAPDFHHATFEIRP
jgi:hypothetical protein